MSEDELIQLVRETDERPDGDELEIDPKILGEKIRAARKKLGISGAELARRIVDKGGRVGRQSVSQWESGKHPPRAKNLILLPIVLGVDAQWLLNDRAPLNTEVPILSRISAGRLKPTDAVEAWQDAPRVHAAGLPAGRWIALEVEGESMNLIAAAGSLIFVNRDEVELIGGKVYAIADENGEATFKRYKANPDRFEPVTSAEGYETYFPSGPIKIIGRVRRVQADL